MSKVAALLWQREHLDEVPAYGLVITDTGESIKYVPERKCKRVRTVYREMRCQIEWECSRCGFPLYSDHDSFCTECGAKVVG